MEELTSQQYQDLLLKAKQTSINSYSPYSHFPVGACVLFESGNTFCGCNVENASFGLSLCAERNALSSAVTAGEKSKLKAIAIYSPKQKDCMPCGACRQWLSEFASCREHSISIKIVLEDKSGGISIYTLNELFPHDFKFETLINNN